MKYTAERLKFQFHNGTINTTGVGIGGSVLSSFNSTTVQLIHKIYTEEEREKLVSIPQRYN